MKNVRTFVRMLCALFLFFSVGFASAGEYVVKKGDSLSRIASANKVEGGWLKIWKINPRIKNPNLIIPNQKLAMPDAAVTPVAARKEEQVLPVLAQNLKQKELQKELKVEAIIAPVPVAATSIVSVKTVSKADATPAILAPVTAPLYVALNGDSSVRDWQATETKMLVREEKLPPAQAPPKDAMTKTSSSTAKAVVTSAVNTDVHVTVVPSNPSVPATAPAVDDFNGRNIILVGATPSNQPAVQENPVVQSAPATAVAQMTKAIPKATTSKPRNPLGDDDDFDNPNVWDSRAIDINGRVIDTRKKSVQTAALAVPVQVLQAQQGESR